MKEYGYDEPEVPEGSPATPGSVAKPASPSSEGEPASPKPETPPAPQSHVVCLPPGSQSSARTLVEHVQRFEHDPWARCAPIASLYLGTTISTADCGERPADMVRVAVARMRSGLRCAYR